MIYFKNSETKEVFAYAKSDIEQVERLTAVENDLTTKEATYFSAQSQLQSSQFHLEELTNSLNEGMAEEDIDVINQQILIATTTRDECLVVCNQAEIEYQSLKDEFNTISPVFFDIRDNLKVMKRMTTKEITAYLNPPVSKEQLIQEAEQQKQVFLVESNKAISPLQDAVDLDMAMETEVALLTEWKKYRVLLNRIDTSIAPDIEWPEKPSAQ